MLNWSLNICEKRKKYMREQRCAKYVYMMTKINVRAQAKYFPAGWCSTFFISENGIEEWDSYRGITVICVCVFYEG